MHIAIAAYAGNIERRDGGGRRVHAFLGAFRDGGHETTLVPIGGHSDGEHLTLAHRVKREFFPMPFRKRGLESQWPDGADLYLSLVPSWHRSALRRGRAWLDYFDLWSAVSDLHARSTRGPARLTSRAQATLWRGRESREASAALARTCAGYPDAQLIPGGAWLPTPVYKTMPPPLAQPQHRVAGMLANWSYPPNRLALDHLIRSWLPTLSKGYEVVVAGFGADTLPSHPDIRNLGEVSSLEDFYRSIDVALAPITFGGGMKVKVVEALAYDRPVLAMPHALEGLPGALAGACGLWHPQISPEDIDALSRPLASPEVPEALALFSQASFAKTVTGLLDRAVDAA
jgi:glycosyltransferase involved in cell wall biosynthesis